LQQSFHVALLHALSQSISIPHHKVLSTSLD
jgi:hypothetical protein